MFILANAEWKSFKRTEQRNNEGNFLRIDIGSKKTIRAWFILRKMTAGVFKSKLPLYQVDNNEAHDLQQKKEKTVKKDRWIIWIISDWKGRPSPDLIELMNGIEVTFQYYLPDGTIKETTFDLTGAREAIEEILK